jgi:hypothetical protein
MRDQKTMGPRRELSCAEFQLSFWRGARRGIIHDGRIRILYMARTPAAKHRGTRT